MFPFVTCGFTGQSRPGYFVCEHVMNGTAAIADIEPASNEKGGFVCCASCALDDSQSASWMYCCGDCAEMNFPQRVGQA
jgi:hypothetical protein